MPPSAWEIRTSNAANNPESRWNAASMASAAPAPVARGRAAIASVKTCGASCPCDDEHASEDGDHAGERNSDVEQVRLP